MIALFATSARVLSLHAVVQAIQFATLARSVHLIVLPVDPAKHARRHVVRELMKLNHALPALIEFALNATRGLLRPTLCLQQIHVPSAHQLALRVKA